MTTDSLTPDLSTLIPGIDIRPAESAYLEEPRRRWHGQAIGVARPRSTEEVARIVQWANRTGTGIVPYGGGTGLVSGQVMPEGPAPLILSLERMSRVRAVHAEEAVLVAEAGAILADVQAAAEAAGLLFPLSLASEGSARIGGLLSTNAGGVNVLRYGNARAQCLGLEAVLPTGEVWHGLTRLRKDNTGYDLRDLLIGAEGTLGVITAAALQLVPRPASHACGFFVVESPAAALRLLGAARAQLAEQVSAFELISGQSLRFLAETHPGVRQPFATKPDWLVLIDLGLAAGTDGAEALGQLFETGAGEGWVSDGVIAASEAQRAEFWTLREMIPEANRAIGAIASHDVSLPLSRIAEFIPEGLRRLAELGDVRVNCFGHLGDGNLHYNVFPAAGQSRDAYEAIRKPASRIVHDLVMEMEGSFSAEHGVGRLKVGDLERYGDPAKLAAMRAIKAALDPAWVMNPGVILRKL